jgi:hypothetical protein
MAGERDRTMIKDLKKLMDEYKAKGWRIEPAKNGHSKWYSPDHETIVVASGTPSDQRAIKNHLSLLRRAEAKIKECNP